MRRLRARISYHDAIKKFAAVGVDVFLGEGKFSAPEAIEVDGKTLRFKKAVIATGARAVRPAIEGLEEAGFLTNETVFSLTERPGRLAVFGAGPLGCEMAQAFRRLGSQVTIVEMGPQLLSREDPDAASIVANAFSRDGIDLKLNSKVTRVERSDGGKVVCLVTGGKEGKVAVDEILVGVGRAPNVEGLNLEAVGVECDGHKGVIVDDHLRTTNPRIYAAGDVCLGFKFTHTADATARMVIQNALFKGRKKLSTLTIPWCTYTDPEIAHVGMYEKDAQGRGIEVRTFVRRFADVDRAIADGEEDGLVKVHVQEGTDRILGGTIVARHAGEMISELTLAIVAGVGLKSLSNVIHPYPTQAEAIRQVADDYNRERLTPRIKRLFNWWLARQRG